MINDQEEFETEEQLEEYLESEGLTEALNTERVINELLRTEWIDEAKQIPLDSCNNEEKLLLLKCINEEEFTQEELDSLQELLAKYRPAIRKYKPQKTIENFEHNQEYVQAERTFLEILQEQQKEEKILTMNYPLNNGTIHELKIKVTEVDSQTVGDIQTQMGMFQDFTEQEQKVKSKQQAGQQLTREEQLILNNMQRKLNEKVVQNQKELFVAFLAKTTIILGEPETEDYLKQVYSTMEYYYLEQLFEKVSVMSGLHIPDADNLFQ